MDKNTISLILAPADTATQLVKRCKTETLRIFDHHNGCIRHIHTDFDDGCRNQHGDFTRKKALHNTLFFRFFHAPVQSLHRNLAAKTRAKCRTVVLHILKRGQGICLHLRTHDIGLMPRFDFALNV